MTRDPGRVAGLLYLLLVAFAPLRLMYIPSVLFVRGNGTATANNIAAHETEELVSNIAFPAVPGEMAFMLWLVTSASPESSH